MSNQKHCASIALSFGLSMMAVAASAQSFTGLGDLPGSIFNSQALGVSADGSVIVGLSVSSNGTEAFRWTSGGGMEGLGDLPGGNFVSHAQDVSDDGTVVVGWSSVRPGFAPYLRSSLSIPGPWTVVSGTTNQSHGMFHMSIVPDLAQGFYRLQK
jgi:probable HAF family extracellular repeat protein